MFELLKIVAQSNKVILSQMIILSQNNEYGQLLSRIFKMKRE